jgi:hypothetical protein
MAKQDNNTGKIRELLTPITEMIIYLNTMLDDAAILELEDRPLMAKELETTMGEVLNEGKRIKNIFTKVANAE